MTGEADKARRNALARWENEGGAIRNGPQQVEHQTPDGVVPGLRDDPKARKVRTAKVRRGANSAGSSTDN